MEHRLGRASALFRHPTPAGVTGTRSAVAGQAIAHQIDIGILAIRRPAAMEVFLERLPVQFQLT